MHRNGYERGGCAPRKGFSTSPSRRSAAQLFRSTFMGFLDGVAGLSPHGSIGDRRRAAAAARMTKIVECGESNVS